MIFCVLLIEGIKVKDLFSASDDELIEQIKKGDISAFDDLYNKYKRPIINYVYRLIGDLSQAEEIAQETFIRVYGNISRYIEKMKFSSWLYTIAGNLAKNYLRDSGRMKKISIDKNIGKNESSNISLSDILPSSNKTPREKLLSEEAEHIVQEAILKLGEKHKKVIILCDIQGLSYEETAKILKCPTATIGSRLSRARENLARLLKGK